MIPEEKKVSNRTFQQHKTIQHHIVSDEFTIVMRRPL